MSDALPQFLFLSIGGVVFAIPILALVGLYAAVPQRASNILDSLRTWMQKNNRPITVALCFVFGAFFLIRGLSEP